MKNMIIILAMLLCGCAATAPRGPAGTKPARAAAAPSPCNEAGLRKRLQEARRQIDLLAARLQAAEAEEHDLREALAAAENARDAMKERNRELARRLRRANLTLERLKRLDLEMEKKRREIR